MRNAGRTVRWGVPTRMVLPRTVTYYTRQASPFAVIVIMENRRWTLTTSFGRGVVAGRIRCLPTMANFHFKAGLVIPVYILNEAGILFQVSALQKQMASTAAKSKKIPLYMNKDSDSYILLEWAVATGFTTCIHSVVSQMSLMFDEDEVLFYWIAIIRWCSRLAFGPLSLLLTTLVYWLFFWQISCWLLWKPNRDFALFSSFSNNASKLFTSCGPVKMGILQSVPSTKFLEVFFVVYTSTP